LRNGTNVLTACDRIDAELGELPAPAMLSQHIFIALLLTVNSAG
jgi:hypothetical protein